MASMICETQLKPQFGAAARTGGISRRRPVFRWLFLALIFSLLWSREFSSADGPRSFLYLESWGGFRLADFLVLGLVYFHLLWILGTRQPLPKIPRILKKPALLSLAALGISVFWVSIKGAPMCTLTGGTFFWASAWPSCFLIGSGPLQLCMKLCTFSLP